jgi:hypothetical protein
MVHAPKAIEVAPEQLIDEHSCGLILLVFRFELFDTPVDLAAAEGADRQPW